MDKTLTEKEWMDEIRRVYGKGFMNFDFGGNENGATITACLPGSCDENEETVGEFYKCSKKSWIKLKK